MLLRREFLAGLSTSLLRGQDKTNTMFGDAEAYEGFIGRWSRLLAPLLVEFTRVPDSGSVLDVGSGTGALAFAIAKSKPRPRVVGIDPSSEYVAYAAKRNTYGDRVTFQVGDAQRLAFPDGAFEDSASLLVFNFIPDPAKAIREVRRVTKPRGSISAAVWDYGDGMRMLRLFWDAAVALDPQAEKLDERHMPLCRAGELSKLWTSAGLENVQEQPLEITMQFRSFADCWDAFRLAQGPVGVYVRSLASGRLQALRDEMKRRLSVTAEDLPFSLPARVWAVRGTVG